MISVLYVDDEEPLLEITKIYLEDTGNFNVETLASAPAALERLTDTFYDCIVSDYQMPDMNGIEFLQKLRSQGNETPFIIFTGKGREEVVIEAINSGADFYLQKGGDPKAQFMELAHKIRRAVQVRTVQKQMLEIVQGSPIPMFVIGRDHRVIFWNRALEEYSGIATSGIVGTMDHWKAFYDRQRPCLADLIVDENVDGIARWYSGKEVKSSFVTGAYEATDFFPKIKDGTWLFFTAAPLKDDSGELIGAVETLQDITSLRTKENELRAAYGQMQEALVKTRASETALVEQNIRLEESEQRYHNVVETQTEFICRFLPDGTHIFVNEAYCRYFGLKREEIVGKQFRADIHPEDKEKFRDHFASLTLDHPMAIITHRVIMPDGEVRWHRWSDQAIFDEHGSLIEYQSVGLDITEQKLAESALLESERQQAEIIDFLPDATLVIDRQGKVIAWNRAIEEMTGVPAGDMLGKDDYEYALPFYGSRRPILIDLIFESDETIAKEYYGIIHRKGSLLIAETSLPRPRGKQAVLWGKASPLYDEQGTIIGAIESIRDVTERRDMEDAIRQREQQLDVIMKNLPVSMFRTTPGPEGSIVMANPLLARMFGYDSPEEFMAGSVARLYADPKKRE
jgi:PAS domain S-box-containing protein